MGTLRFLLAMMVVIGHLFGPNEYGMYAVFGFYTISGYLMTMVMHKNYGYSLRGKTAFALNRFLRIYPAYWFAIIFSILCIQVIGSEKVTQYHQSIFIPQNHKEWIQNIFILFNNSSLPRLSPPTWALTVELFWYGAIGLGLSKTAFRTCAWFIVSIAITLIAWINGQSGTQLYFPIWAASLPFSIGAFIFHGLGSGLLKLLNKISPAYPILIFGLIQVNFLVSFITDWNIKTNLTLGAAFYINLILITCMVCFFHARVSIPERFKKTDKLFGDLSYGIYLLHWQVGLLTSTILFGTAHHGKDVRGVIALICSLPILIFISYLLNRFVEKPIDLARHKIKVYNGSQKI